MGQEEGRLVSRRRRIYQEEEPVAVDSPEATLHAIGHYVVAVWLWRPPHPIVPLLQRERDELTSRNASAAVQVERLLEYADELGVGDHLRSYLVEKQNATVRERLKLRPPAPRTPEAEAEAARLLHRWPPEPDVDVWRGSDHFTPKSTPKQTRRNR